MSNQNKEPKRFEDWIEVDCENCERWWLSQCDGVKTPSDAHKMPCTSFLATRKTVIPLQIKSLKTSIIWLRIGVVGIALIELILGIILLVKL
jgi:hypothetical protein